jgi:MFS transporter, putative metabolite transport protein
LPPRSSPRSWSPSDGSSSRKARTGFPPGGITRKPRSRLPSYSFVPRNIQPISACGAITTDVTQPKQSFWALFDRQNRRATIFASVPWFLQDLGTYGIGIFTPTILAAALGGGSDHIRSVSDLISDGILAAEGSALITALLIVGIAFAVVLADILGRIKLQIGGFIGCALGLLLASFSIDFEGAAKIQLIFAGFMLFNFMTNIGPNAQTYLLAGEVFPTAVRGMGAGFAAAFAKIGAVLTAFLFPVMLDAVGTRILLYGLVVTSILGAIITWLFRIETTGVNLDEIGRQPAE